VQPQETLASIASRYGLLSATLMGLNPAIRSGSVRSGQTLTIPPYNGVLVSVPPGQTLQDLAKRYRVRPDVLFEINGCQRSPKVIFVPGVSWSPLGTSVTATPSAQVIEQVAVTLQQDRYPLPQLAVLKRSYGQQPRDVNNSVSFSSGVELAAVSGTPVYAVADGTIAFAGAQAPWGVLVVINHAQGRQTRYGYLQAVTVKVGQSIRRGQVIGQVGAIAAALRFELRYRSAVGWVAQDPQPYLEAITPQ
jgi:lysostaphin